MCVREINEVKMESYSCCWKPQQTWINRNKNNKTDKNLSGIRVMKEIYIHRKLQRHEILTSDVSCEKQVKMKNQEKPGIHKK